MERLKQEALLRMFAYGALAINAPAHGKPLPVTVRLELVECMPSVRESVLEVLADSLRDLKIDALASVPGGCRTLVSLLAHQLKLPCIMPATASPDEYAAVMLYGPDRSTLAGKRVVAVQEYARNANAFERMVNSLGLAGCEVRHAVSLLDADRDGLIPRWASSGSANVEYRAVFTLTEVFSVLRHDAAFGGVVEPGVLAAAETHFKSSKQSVRPAQR